MIYICNLIVLWKVIDLYWNIRYYSIENSIILVYEEMGFPLWIVYDLKSMNVAGFINKEHNHSAVARKSHRSKQRYTEIIFIRLPGKPLDFMEQ